MLFFAYRKKRTEGLRQETEDVKPDPETEDTKEDPITGHLNILCYLQSEQI